MDEEYYTLCKISSPHKEAVFFCLLKSLWTSAFIPVGAENQQRNNNIKNVKYTYVTFNSTRSVQLTVEEF